MGESKNDEIVFLNQVCENTPYNVLIRQYGHDFACLVLGCTSGRHTIIEIS